MESKCNNTSRNGLETGNTVKTFPLWPVSALLCHQPYPSPSLKMGVPLLVRSMQQEAWLPLQSQPHRVVVSLSVHLSFLPPVPSSTLVEPRSDASPWSHVWRLGQQGVCCTKQQLPILFPHPSPATGDIGGQWRWWAGWSCWSTG